MTIEPTNYRLNGADIQVGSSQPTPPIAPDHEKDADKDQAAPSEPSTGEHNHGGEHNHNEEPLPDNVNTDPLAEGG